MLKRLHATGLFELCELGSFGSFDDPRQRDIPWKFISCMPDPRDSDQVRRYESHVTNKFGAWKFEDTCLDFRPDVVWSFRDFWYETFQFQSPFRKFYYLSHMPPVDAVPLADQWVSTYAEADAVFAYTDWGLEVLKNQSGGRIKTVCSAPPGADTDVFHPVSDRKAFQRTMGLPEGAVVIGTTMRAQKRKLFNDLINAFAKLVAEAPESLRGRVYLYLHTSYPDVAWDIPKLVRDSGVANRVLFTYHCKVCKEAYPSHFAGGLTHCRACGSASAVLPDVLNGVSRETLARVFNTMDAYVQMAVCLKPGTPIYTSEGWKPIEIVGTSDVVMTHKGNWKKVVRTFKHENKTARRLKFWGTPDELVITNEHPVYAITDKQVSIGTRNVREVIGERIGRVRPIPEPAFVRADQIKPGDLLAYRIDDQIKNKQFVDLAEYCDSDAVVTEEFVRLYHGHPHYRRIPVTADLCWFLGLYAAEGCATRKKGKPTGTVRITTHSREANLRHRVRRVFSDFSDRVVKGRNAVDVNFHSLVHARWLDSECGKGLNKRLPAWAMYLPHRLQMYLLYGLFAGDGCWVRDRKYTLYCTISPVLREQVEWLLRRCRINYNLRITRKKGNRKPQYTFEVPGNLGGGRVTTKRSSTGSLYHGPWHLMKVKTVEVEVYHGDVHNIEVEDDNSYLTNLSIVHNCEGFGMPQVEAASCGVPVFSVDYSAMSDVVRKVNGFPLKVLKYNREAESHRLFAVPDDDDFVRQLTKFLTQPESLIRRSGFLARQGVLQNYTYERTAKVWEEHFLSSPLRDHATTWDSPPRFIKPNTNFPAGLSNEDWVRWGISQVMGRPDLADSYMAMRMTRDLNWGSTTGGMGGVPFNDASALGLEMEAQRARYDRDTALKQMLAAAEQWNHWERRRAGVAR